MLNDELGYSVVELDYQEDTDEEVKETEPMSLAGSDLKYPCIILKGVTIMEELDFFKNLLVEDTLALPLFVEVFDKVFELGRMELTHKSMLCLPRSAIDSYELFLAKSEDNIKKLDIADSSLLKKLIKLD